MDWQWYLASTTEYGELGIEKKYKNSFVEAIQHFKYRYKYDQSKAKSNCNQHDRNTTLDDAISTPYITWKAHLAASKPQSAVRLV
jgi:hypothetical protein